MEIPKKEKERKDIVVKDSILGVGVFFCSHCKKIHSKIKVRSYPYFDKELCNNCYHNYFRSRLNALKEKIEDRKKKRILMRRYSKMKIKFKDYAWLEALCRFINCLSDILELRISKKNIKSRFIDMSRITLISISIPSEVFKEYDILNTSFIRLETLDFQKLLKNLIETENNNLIIERCLKKKDVENPFIKLTTDLATMTFNYTDLEFSYGYKDTPIDNLKSIEYPVEVNLSITTLMRILNQAFLFSQLIAFGFKDNKEDKLYMYSEGHIGQYIAEINPELYKCNFTEKIKLEQSKEKDFLTLATYSNNILKKCLEEIEDYISEITLYLRTDHPMLVLIKFRFGGFCRFWIAPRVSENEYNDFD